MTRNELNISTRGIPTDWGRHPCRGCVDRDSTTREACEDCVTRIVWDDPNNYKGRK